MAVVALTDIRYGIKSDEKGIEIEPAKTIKAGDKVDKKLFSTEDYQALVDNGAVGETPVVEEAPVEE